MLTNSLFVRAEQDWNLDEIYQAIIELKIKDNKAKDLSNREKLILSGLLCSFHPDIIARQLPGASYEVNLDRAWELYDYLQKIALEKLNPAEKINYDLFSLITLLSATEFKKNNTDLKEETLLFERNRFMRADKIIAVIYTPTDSQKIPNWEMMLSTGAVCQNITIAAQSLNYAVQWVTEWYSYNDKMLEYLGGDISKDKLAGFIYIGEKKEDPVERIRPKFEKVIKFLN